MAWVRPGSSKRHGLRICKHWKTAWLDKLRKKTYMPLPQPSTPRVSYSYSEINYSLSLSFPMFSFSVSPTQLSALCSKRNHFSRAFQGSVVSKKTHLKKKKKSFTPGPVSTPQGFFLLWSFPICFCFKLSSLQGPCTLRGPRWLTHWTFRRTWGKCLWREPYSSEFWAWSSVYKTSLFSTSFWKYRALCRCHLLPTHTQLDLASSLQELSSDSPY